MPNQHNIDIERQGKLKSGKAALIRSGRVDAIVLSPIIPRRLMSHVMRNILVVLLFSILTLGLAVSSFAKMYEEPRSFSLEDKSLQQVDRKVLKKIDPESLLAEDRKRGKDPRRPGPLRFAVTENVAFNLENSGTWQSVSDGRIWRLLIQSPGAVSQNLGITRFDLPKGAKLWIYDPTRKHVEGPYTSSHRSRHGRLWTPVIEGDEIVIELFVPAGAPKTAIVIGKVNKGYLNLSKGGADKNHGTCNNDVICPEGDPWRDQIRSVARYSIDGTALCTGQLVNNTALDFTPYFLSANHCGVSDTNDDTLVFYWNYEAPNCGDQDGGSLTDTQTGAIFRASYAPSDFVLVELAGQPDPAFNVFFTGWDAAGTAASSTVGIHHPRGHVKSISFNTNAVTSTDYLSDTVNAGEDHWRIDDWEDGTTEGGSSGSCLWDAATKRCVGQLHGGYAYCTAPDESDWYGKLSVSWNGGGTAATRLRDWLDPGNTGIMALDGDPHITTADGIHYDFQGAGEYTVLRNASGLEIQARQTPIATTFNPGANPYHGLATCVSLNTAVAARVGNHRISYQPNISGVPDPSGLQLRVDGNLMTLGANGLDLGDGGRIAKTSSSGGLEIDFPDNSVLLVTPGWWASQSKWYLNVDVVRSASTVMNGVSGNSARVPSTGGLMSAIAPGSWLPALPDGTSMGPMPNSLHQRYINLYQKFGDAWRVTDKTSLFDYAPGTSTDTFTMRTWPLENPPCVIPETKPVKPVSKLVAQRACQAVKDKSGFKNCVFDVMVTGEPGFAKTYLASRRVLAVSTKTTVTDDENPTQVGEWVTFTATVAALSGKGAPTGTVQFILDDAKVGGPVKLDSKGRATWETSRLKKGDHRIAAVYSPGKGSELLTSTSPKKLHTVKRCVCESTAERK